MTTKEKYINFLKSKMAISQQTGFDVSIDEMTPGLYPHVKASVQWAIKGGCRAVFSSFGLHKTNTQLEIERIIVKNKGGKGLIVCPKKVIAEFEQQAKKHIGIDVTYVRNMQEVMNCTTDIMITNYERVRDGADGVRIDPSYFKVTSLDEASVLRGYGTKTYQTFLDYFKDVEYKFVATATPAPNRYKELIHYAGYLGVMDTGQALTRFFDRDSTKANNLTLKKSQEAQFWIWMSTWALVITKPSDLGFSDEGFSLPELEYVEEVVDVDNSTAGIDRDGQVKMYRESALSLSDAAKERRDSLSQKIERILEIINRPENKDDHFIFWHDQEAERHALCRAIPGCKAVYGTQDENEADVIIDEFRHGKLKYLAAKPVMLGEGINFQHHCHKAIMFIDDRFNDKFQAIHRIYRFMQKYKVTIYFVYAESESVIFQRFMNKWAQHNEMIESLAKIVRENGLTSINAEQKMMRWMFARREVRKGKLFESVNNDNVLECLDRPDNSIGLIVTSWPFSNHYEYTPTFNDFGYNLDNDDFFKQMDFLTRECYRMLQPGRVMAVHVKDRVLFGNATGDGMPTIDPFHALCIFHGIKHNFRFFGMITVDTDVVRENNQTYRLGYTEMCKDGSKMGVGCPEYVLLFRKLPSSTSKAYADIPVTHEKHGEYSLARWQIDAHADWKSSGDTLLDKYDFAAMEISQIRYLFRNFEREHVYNFERHVEFAEFLESKDKLPKKFMAIDPVSKKPWIWDDVTRMRTLNTRQSQKNRQNHICPLQLDIVERLIERYSHTGDVIFDPFGGIGTVPYCAIKMGRKALSMELNYDYWKDGLIYQIEAEEGVLSPTLFDLLEEA
ncbi:DNA methyltransferase [Parabacteroides sp. Marseille-P3160]|uniref:DNA methyltransferase n=1 Tax=Parabacteroides sp. Marseille-P3160 TaxID=1917887 RepID=UPI001F172DCD|nr:DNA methyltransferase [Parabacteroides sp. Marseille-P3160]